MFAEQLNLLVSVLNANNTELARFVRCDRSNISRMRSGARVPRRAGVTTEKLVRGLCLLADDRELMSALCSCIGCPPDTAGEELHSRLTDWLFRDADETQRVRRPSKPSFRSFGERLSAVMEMTGLSNVRFSRLLSVDASHISRFRRGLRTPQSNPKTVEAICTVLLQRVREQGQMSQLARMMGLSAAELESDPDCLDRFQNWLCDFSPEDNGIMVENLLEHIDTFPVSAMQQGPDPAAVDPDALTSTETSYRGNDGLRRAVIRFLSAAALQGGEELLLYSDQSMDWMLSDRTFHRRWASLMMACVRRGVRIRIIHNIDRAAGEMVEAISSWLPLYLSGVIESWYSRRTRDSRFSHTIFLCPGLGCIVGDHVAGCEDDGLYRFCTSPEELEYYSREFAALLDASRPLVRMTASAEGPEPGGDFTLLSNTLSLGTMPEETMMGMLRRLDPALRAEAECQWRSAAALWERRLAAGQLSECVPLAEDEMLFAGRVPVDLEGVTLCYEPAEYDAHLKNMARLSEQRRGYRFYLLPETPFANTRLLLDEDEVAVERLTRPHIVFRISHPLMLEAFTAYLDRIKEQFREDKPTQRKRLEQRSL